MLHREGRSAYTGFLSDETFGGLRTGSRAILLAKRSGRAALPTPTHRPLVKGIPTLTGDPAPSALSIDGRGAWLAR